jgi:cytochrome c oxidase subunit 2
VKNIARFQSVLDSAGPFASRIENLWWTFFWTATVVYLLVLIGLLVALMKRRGDATERSERTALHLVATASGLTVVAMFALLITSIVTGRSLADSSIPPVNIELTGHQWWWQIDYDDHDKSKRFSTANEIYIPVGEPVRIKLRTADVIHSFWVPNLHGKRDLITGHDAEIRLFADRAGTFRGQCAEFCGLQHAKMALWVTAVPKAEYAKWADAQRRHAVQPVTREQQHGQQLLLATSCPICHTIRGTEASGKKAPDLTHVASRQWIAAASLRNTRANLTSWIRNPQHVKPGSFMPPSPLGARDLDDLVTYLESLQ